MRHQVLVHGKDKKTFRVFHHPNEDAPRVTCVQLKVQTLKQHMSEN